MKDPIFMTMDERLRVFTLEVENLNLLRHSEPTVNATLRKVMTRCKFCGDFGRELDNLGNCTVCVDGMARTNGD